MLLTYDLAAPVSPPLQRLVIEAFQHASAADGVGQKHHRHSIADVVARTTAAAEAVLPSHQTDPASIAGEISLLQRPRDPAVATSCASAALQHPQLRSGVGSQHPAFCQHRCSQFCHPSLLVLATLSENLPLTAGRRDSRQQDSAMRVCSLPHFLFGCSERHVERARRGGMR